MAGEFIKPTSISPVAVGQIADPDIYNNNIAAQNKDSVTFIDANGSYSDGTVGDESLGSIGSLVETIKLREGGLLKYYNASGTFTGDVNLGQATSTLLGQVLLYDRIAWSISTGDSDHDVVFTAGTFIFDDNSGQATVVPLIKQIDAVWANGNAGGLDTGSVSSNTHYHMFAIYNPTTLDSDFLYSQSLSPTMPSGYTKKKRLGTVITDSSSNIRNGQFFFHPDGSYEFLYDVPVLDIDTAAQSTTAILHTLSIPSGIKTKAIFNAFINDTSTSISIYFSSPDNDDLAPSSTVSPLNNFSKSVPSGNANNSGQFGIYADAARRIRARANTALSNLRIATLGWYDFDL